MHELNNSFTMDHSHLRRFLVHLMFCWLHYLKQSQTIALKYCIVFLSTRKYCCLIKKLHIFDKLHSGMSSMSMIQLYIIFIYSYILNKMSLNRNIHKSKLAIHQLWKTLWPETHRHLTCISWRARVLICQLNVCSNLTTMISKIDFAVFALK